MGEGRDEGQTNDRGVAEYELIISNDEGQTQDRGVMDYELVAGDSASENRKSSSSELFVDEAMLLSFRHGLGMKDGNDCRNVSNTTTEGLRRTESG